MSASYGIINHYSYVLDQTIQLINNNILDFKVSNNIFGDPYPRKKEIINKIYNYKI